MKVNLCEIFLKGPLAVSLSVSSSLSSSLARSESIGSRKASLDLRVMFNNDSDDGHHELARLALALDGQTKVE